MLCLLRLLAEKCLIFRGQWTFTSRKQIKFCALPFKTFSREVSDLHGSVEDLSSRCEELMNGVPFRDREEIGEQLNTLKARCEDLEGTCF